MRKGRPLKPWIILSRRGQYSFIGLAIIAVVGSSARPTLQARQKEKAEETSVEQGRDDKAVQDFVSVYRLAPGQNLKRIEPPRSSGAAIWWNRKFGKNAGTGPEQYAVMMFRFRDPNHLENFAGLFGSATEGYPIRNIPDAIGMDVDPAEIDGDRELLKTTVTGDWVFREGVPAERMASSLESVLQRALRRRIKIAFRQVERDVVVARGRYRNSPLPGRSHNQIDLYGKQLVKDANTISSDGDFPAFLKQVGGFIRRPVVDEVEARPKEPISWFHHVRSPFTERMRREDHDEAGVLEHLHEQTGLTFTREMKPVRVLFIERAE
jgi:hypothetical protein